MKNKLGQRYFDTETTGGGDLTWQMTCSASWTTAAPKACSFQEISHLHTNQAPTLLSFQVQTRSGMHRTVILFLVYHFTAQ